MCKKLIRLTRGRPVLNANWSQQTFDISMSLHHVPVWHWVCLTCDNQSVHPINMQIIYCWINTQNTSTYIQSKFYLQIPIKLNMSMNMNAIYLLINLNHLKRKLQKRIIPSIIHCLHLLSKQEEMYRSIVKSSQN